MENESRFTFIWAIENSSDFVSNCSLYSPVFIAKSLEMTKWHLILCHFPTDPSFYFKVLREEEDDGPKSIKVALNISFLGANDLLLMQVNTGLKIFSRNSFCCLKLADKGNVFGQRRSEILPNNILTIRCRMWHKATSISRQNLCFARTRMGKDQHFFIWPITDLSSLQAGGERMRLLKSSAAYGTEYTSFNINCKDAEKPDFVTGEIHVVDAEGAVVQSEKCETFLPKDEDIWEQLGPSELPVMATDVPDITLNVLNNNSTTESCPFTEVFTKFYEESTLTDVVLQTDSESFAVHRIVFSCRSAVFGGMLSGDRLGELRKIIHLPGINADTLRHLILYIYKSEVPKLEWEGLADLFRAATTFELLELKQQCCTILKSHISETNVCSLLSLADMYGEEELFKKVLDFILKKSDILKSDAWNTFKMKNSRLALEATERIIFKLISSDCLRRLYM